MVSRATWMKSTCAFEVISPASSTRPVVHRVSAATREVGSCASSASRTASDTWSATLSGWPSDTDSEVNRYSWAMSFSPIAANRQCFGALPDRAKPRRFSGLYARPDDRSRPAGCHDLGGRWDCIIAPVVGSGRRPRPPCVPFRIGGSPFPVPGKNARQGRYAASPASFPMTATESPASIPSPHWLVRLAGALPLAVLRSAGALLGWLVYAGAPAYRGRLVANLDQAGYGDAPAVRRRAIAEAGRMVAE